MKCLKLNGFFSSFVYSLVSLLIVWIRLGSSPRVQSVWGTARWSDTCTGSSCRLVPAHSCTHKSNFTPDLLLFWTSFAAGMHLRTTNHTSKPAGLLSPNAVWQKGGIKLTSRHALSTSVGRVPDKLVVVEEGGVFDQAQALLHSVNKRLDLQIGHLVQRKEADASENVQQVTGLQVESLQILETPGRHARQQRRRKGERG